MEENQIRDKNVEEHQDWKRAQLTLTDHFGDCLSPSISKINVEGNTPHKQKKKPTYKQNWSKYDEAKTNESVLFKILLDELLNITASEIKTKHIGRKSIPLKDKIIAVITKIYTHSDLRKTVSILKELHKLGYISKIPCFRSIDNFFYDKAVAKMLDDLIFITALPLANLEKVGAMDSTGFSTSRFDQWFNFRYGRSTGRERRWRKLHAFVGCNTHIVVAAKITDKDTGDATQVKKVLGIKPLLFDMEDFVADKAYSSREIMNFIDALGLNPYIPFKSNATGKAKGSLIWSKMYKQFINNREQYMNRYHERSNIETANHMIKTRFGDSLKTKNFEGNVVEIKAKIICHNLCCLIAQIYENDIHIDFESCAKKAYSVQKGDFSAAA
jgi:transposase